MEKLMVVEEAKKLMNEAEHWSVMKWLREKKSVRKAADKANAALDAMNRDLKARWDGELRTAYEQVSKGNGSSAIPADLLATAKRIKQADEQATSARADAENTFDEAERQLSTTMARQGCGKAINSWVLHEKANVMAEEAAKRTVAR